MTSEIKVSNHEFDMSSWYCEKIYGAIEELSKVVTEFSNDKGQVPDLILHTFNYLYTMLSMSSGVDVEDIQQAFSEILSAGHPGFHRGMVRLGERHHSLEPCTRSLEKLLQNIDNGHDHTQVYQCLKNMLSEIKGKNIQEIQRLLNQREDMQSPDQWINSVRTTCEGIINKSHRIISKL